MRSSNNALGVLLLLVLLVIGCAGIFSRGSNVQQADTPAATFPPLLVDSTAYWKDDFLSGTDASGSIGETGWSAELVGAAGVGFVYYSGTDAENIGHPGVLNLETDAMNGNRVTIWTPDQPSIIADHMGHGFDTGTGTFSLRMLVRLQNTDADTTMVCGLAQASVDAGTDLTASVASTTFFRKSSASANWRIINNQTGGADTDTDTTIAADTDWVGFRFSWTGTDGVGDATFTFGIQPEGGAESTFTGPYGATQQTSSGAFCQLKTGANAAKLALLDFVDLYITGLNRL